MRVAGPFARWHHEHLFEQIPGGTRMTDHVEFVSPLAGLGRLVDRLVLTRYMTRLIRQRNQWLADTLAANPA